MQETIDQAKARDSKARRLTAALEDIRVAIYALEAPRDGIDNDTIISSLIRVAERLEDISNEMSVEESGTTSKS